MSESNCLIPKVILLFLGTCSNWNSPERSSPEEHGFDAEELVDAALLREPSTGPPHLQGRAEREHRLYHQSLSEQDGHSGLRNLLRQHQSHLRSGETKSRTQKHPNLSN